MRYLRRNQVDETPVDTLVINDDEGRYDNTPTHREAIRAVIRHAVLRSRRNDVLDDINETAITVARSEAVVSSLTHRASVNRWSQEIIWASVFVGFVFDFLLWQDIFTGRFELGALSLAAERASAVVCSLAYAYVCSQVGIAAFVRVAAIRRTRGTDIEGDNIERASFGRAVSRASLTLWGGLFVLLTGVSTLGRFTQEGSTEDHALLTLVAVAIALVIAVMAYQYHDIYAHDLRTAKSTGNKSVKRLRELRTDLNTLDTGLIESSLNASLLSCACGRGTCPVPVAREYLELSELVRSEPSDTESESEPEPEPEPAVVEETPMETPVVVDTPLNVVVDTGDSDDVVMLKQLPSSGNADTEALASEIAAKDAAIENLTVENKYWKSKARQYKAKHGRLDELVTKLVNAVLEKGSEPMFYRVVSRHRREWESLWSAIDKILVEYADGAPTT